MQTSGRHSCLRTPGAAKIPVNAMTSVGYLGLSLWDLHGKNHQIQTGIQTHCLSLLLAATKIVPAHALFLALLGLPQQHSSLALNFRLLQHWWLHGLHILGSNHLVALWLGWLQLLQNIAKPNRTRTDTKILHSSKASKDVLKSSTLPTRTLVCTHFALLRNTVLFGHLSLAERLAWRCCLKIWRLTSSSLRVHSRHATKGQVFERFGDSHAASAEQTIQIRQIKLLHAVST